MSEADIARILFFLGLLALAFGAGFKAGLDRERKKTKENLSESKEGEQVLYIDLRSRDKADKTPPDQRPYLH